MRIQIMQKEEKNILISIAATLEQIDVHGKKNLNMLLGCILEIEKLLNGGQNENTPE